MSEKKQQSGHTVGIWLNDKQHSRLSKKAAELGVTKGALIKKSAFNKVDSIHIKRTVYNRVNPELIRQLAWIGNNLNQISHRMNTVDVDPAELISISMILSEMNDNMEGIRHGNL